MAEVRSLKDFYYLCQRRCFRLGSTVLVGDYLASDTYMTQLKQKPQPHQPIVLYICGETEASYYYICSYYCFIYCFCFSSYSSCSFCCCCSSSCSFNSSYSSSSFYSSGSFYSFCSSYLSAFHVSSIIYYAISC